MPLTPFSYDVIVADPNWQFQLYSQKGEAKSAQAHYDCSPLDEIKSYAPDGIPVRDLARGDCLLFLWATCPMLPEAVEVLQAWGARYCTAMSWRKVTKNGKQQWGPGYRVRGMFEPILIGTFGKPPLTGAFPAILEAPDEIDGHMLDGLAREHSRKPDEFYKLVAEKTPKALRRLDLFSGGHIHAGFEGHGHTHRTHDYTTDEPSEAPQ